VVVTTTPGFAGVWLIPRLASFTAVHPGVDVRISAGNGFVNLVRDGVDLAIRYHTREGVGEQAERLFGEVIFPVCSPKLARDPARPLKKPEDLRHHVLINLHDPSGRWPWLSWAQWLEAAGIQDFTPAATLSFDQYDQVITAALHGQGVALGRMSITEQYRRDKRLTLLFGRRQCLERGYYLVFAKGAAERPEVKRFTAWMRSEVAPAAAEAAATAS
jgi:DNA-binding transcriptional LysR family regulator